MLTIQFAELSGGAAAGFTLDASRASTSGGVSLDRSSGILRRFSSQGSRATWDARQATADKFEVFITYATPPPIDNPDYENGSSAPKMLAAGGTVAIREASSLTRPSDNQLTAKIEPTGSWDSFKTISLGTMTLNSAATSIEIVATGVEPQGLMHLRSIRFKRIPPPLAPDAPPPAILASLRDEHSSRLDTAITPATKSYIAALEKLASETAASGDLDEVVAIRAEIERAAKKSAADADSTTDPRMRDSIILGAVDTLRVRKSDSVLPSSNGYLTNLAPGGAFVEWDIQRLNLPPGFYEIGLRYRNNNRSGGTFRVHSGNSSFTGSLSRNENFSPDTPFQDRPWGIVYLVEKSASVRLTVSSLLPGGNSLCDLQSLSLRLTDRESFEQAKDRERTSSDSKWVKLEGAKLAPADNTVAGDNIYVNHAGKKLHIRLYGADCPYEEQGSPENSSQAGNFGISGKPLNTIARDANRFARKALMSGPFIIYTKNEKAEQSGNGERIHAFIVTQKGLLSHQLILAGLARVKGKFSDAPDEINPGVTAEIHEQWLRGEQEKAKKANRGIWKFRK